MKMLKIKYLLAIVSAFVLLTSQAYAGVITDVEEIDSTVGWVEVKSWTHDLSDQDFVLGTALSAKLTIQFSDDRDRWGEGELASIIVGIIDFQDGELLYTPTSDWTGDLGFNSLAGLNANGLLDVRIWSTILPFFNDFYIGNSILDVTTAAVPEPATLLLMGMGLVGLGVNRFRKAKA